MEAQSSEAITGRDSGATFIHDTNTVRIQALAAISTPGRGGTGGGTEPILTAPSTQLFPPWQRLMDTWYTQC